MKAICLITAILLFSLIAIHLRAEEEWSSDQKEACTALLREYPSTIEPVLHEGKQRDYWHKLLLTDKAIHFRRLSQSEALADGEFYHGPAWEPIYESKDNNSDKSDVWSIIVDDPAQYSTSKYLLFVYINTTSKKVVTAWLIGGL